MVFQNIHDYCRWWLAWPVSTTTDAQVSSSFVPGTCRVYRRGMFYSTSYIRHLNVSLLRREYKNTIVLVQVSLRRSFLHSLGHAKVPWFFNNLTKMSKNLSDSITNEYSTIKIKENDKIYATRVTPILYTSHVRTSVRIAVLTLTRSTCSINLYFQLPE